LIDSTDLTVKSRERLQQSSFDWNLWWTIAREWLITKSSICIRMILTCKVRLEFD
jgi:hypothetical protein